MATPAVDQDWLELPTGLNGSRYVVNTLSAGGERNYTHLYDTENYVSLWTAYPLNDGHMGSYSRPSNWNFNPELSADLQPDLCNGSYEGGTYSRGHMIPNGARNGIREMQLQTFYVTNSVPQRQDKFNGSIWNAMEQAVQGIVKGSDEEIYVVTGVSFNKIGEAKAVDYITPKNDTKQCAIPNYFYTVVLRVKQSGSVLTDAETIGFWFEHKDYSDSVYSNYEISVDQIEKWTGFDFFVNLPDDLEKTAETNSSWETFTSF